MDKQVRPTMGQTFKLGYDGDAWDRIALKTIWQMDKSAIKCMSNWITSKIYLMYKVFSLKTYNRDNKIWSLEIRSSKIASSDHNPYAHDPHMILKPCEMHVELMYNQNTFNVQLIFI